jgi:hypothetical protein
MVSAEPNATSLARPLLLLPLRRGTTRVAEEKSIVSHVGEIVARVRETFGMGQLKVVLNLYCVGRKQPDFPSHEVAL